jgi:hypothetical protein
MPLARLSIKSALRLAQRSVSLHYHSGLWSVRTRFGENGEAVVSQSQAMTRAAAKVVRRERRIFMALRALDIDPVVAAQLSIKAKTDPRDWRKLVAFYLERHELG